MDLNEEEIHALQYYAGMHVTQEEKDPFWSDPKAYVTLNSLFFDGIETEQARSHEGRTLNPAIASQSEKFLAFTRNLYHACMKYPHAAIRVSRVERLVDYCKFCEKGMFTSFISTSRNGFLTAYEDKYDLVLMDILIDADVPCIDLVQMLPENEKEEEGEVLIAPYAKILVREVPLPEPLKEIKDGKGNPPAVYCEIHVSHAGLPATKTGIFTQKDTEAVYSLYHTLNMHAYPDEKDILAYEDYKQRLQAQIFQMFSKTI